MNWILLGEIAVFAVLVWLATYLWPRPRTVLEHERGVRYRRGHLVGEVGPGRYWLRPRIDELTVVDIRRRQAVVAGQEVLSADRVPLKISLITEFTVSDVLRAVTGVERFEDVLYGRLQLALREAVSGQDLDSVLEERGELGTTIQGLVQESAAELGIELHSVQVRDFMMAGGLRGAYTEVVEARQQGLAALERARGESAALRSLANAAQLMERHPGIMQLRLLQAVESGTGNRVVIAMDPDRSRSAEVDVAAEGEA